MSAWIEMIDDDHAGEALRDVLALARTPHGTVDNVMRVHSLRPATMRGHVMLYRAALHDEGNTLAAIKGSVEKRQAASVKTAVLVRKMHDRGLDRDYADFVGLDVPDVYIYGCGMDAYEHWRHLDHILALETD